MAHHRFATTAERWLVEELLPEVASTLHRDDLSIVTTPAEVEAALDAQRHINDHHHFVVRVVSVDGCAYDVQCAQMNFADDNVFADVYAVEMLPWDADGERVEVSLPERHADALRARQAFLDSTQPAQVSRWRRWTNR